MKAQRKEYLKRIGRLTAILLAAEEDEEVDLAGPGWKDKTVTEPWKITRHDYTALSALPRSLLVNPHASALRQDAQLRAQRNWQAVRSAEHHAAVLVALRAGLPVPTVVLADYGWLAAKYHAVTV